MGSLQVCPDTMEQSADIIIDQASKMALARRAFHSVLNGLLFFPQTFIIPRGEISLHLTFLYRVFQQKYWQSL